MNVPVEVCANCGKESSDAVKLKNCNACLLVKYCGVDCQKTHRKQHKEACKKRAAELKDERLYARGHERPERDFCPICTMAIPLPVEKHSRIQLCCMKVICDGCIVADELRGRNRARSFAAECPPCPFCRTPSYKDNESALAMVQKRIDAGDADAKKFLGLHYLHGELYGLKKDLPRAIQLLTDAAEHGSLDALFELGNLYYNGEGVVKDEREAIRCWEKAAMQGQVEARHNLGADAAGRKHNTKVAIKHFLISAKMGDKNSMDYIKTLFEYGYATNDQYSEALKGYGDAVEEMKSQQREEAQAILNFAPSKFW